MDLSGSGDADKKSQAAFGAGQPLATATVTDSTGTHSLDVRKNKDDYYARSAPAGTPYKVAADLGKELEKSVEEFRNKKVFDFGFSDPSKFELIGTAGEKAYVRSGTDWKQGSQVVDPGTVQAFIDKVRDLAATKFATSGFATPEFGLTVTSNEGKRVERVEFAKAKDGYLARRGNEPALYELDAKAVSEMINAATTIKPAAPVKK